jgi:chromate transporter
VPDNLQPEEAPAPIDLRTAFWYWLKLGFISFGGPTGQIAIMYQDLVEKRRWISEKRFLHALNYCMVLPGPEATQLAVYIGWIMHGAVGGVIAGSLFILPALFILMALSWAYMAYGDLPAAAGVLYGIKPAVTAIVIFAAWRIGSRALKNPLLWSIAAAAFVAIFGFGLPYPAIVLSAAIIGFVGGRIVPGKFTVGGELREAARAYGPAIIDDTTPAPAHARFSWRHLILLCAGSLALWSSAIGLLAAMCGWDGTLTKMAWFFTKTAMLGFGGAYAVLPYVYQGGVEQYHWLNATQMIDGLALGETTPGPLIMVVSFVGFVGGWSAQLFGPDRMWLAGCAAAMVVTFFTFLPSFIFVFLGGPLIESTHGNLKFTAPLTGITAAVVGVILNLAAFFAYHVLWPAGLNGIFDWVSAMLGVAAGIALFRCKIGIIPVILGSGGFGMLYRLVFG